MIVENLTRNMCLDQTLRLHCDACGHQVAFDRESAFKLFGPPDASPFELRGGASAVNATRQGA